MLGSLGPFSTLLLSGRVRLSGFVCLVQAGNGENQLAFHIIFRSAPYSTRSYLPVNPLQSGGLSCILSYREIVKGNSEVSSDHPNSGLLGIQNSI
jgi:hypothetical protein